MTRTPFEPSLLTHRIFQVLRADKDKPEDSIEGRPAAIGGALSSIHSLSQPLLVVTARSAPGAPISVLLNAPAELTSPSAGLPGNFTIDFPLGSSSKRLSKPGLPPGCDGLSWLTLPLIFRANEEERTANISQLLQSRLLTFKPPWAIAFLAKPASELEIKKRIDEISLKVPGLTQRSSQAEAARQLEYIEKELDLLDEIKSFGGWELTTFIGANSEALARSIAGLVAFTDDLLSFPVCFGRPLASSEQAVTDPSRHVMFISHQVLGALVHPPSVEIPGLRAYRAPQFDVVPEQTGDIELGRILDMFDQPVGSLKVSRDTLNRHAFVTGATGSGKSQTVRKLLESLSANNVPWMVVEPAKAEYGAIAGRVAPTEVVVIRPGALDVPPAGLNPLEPSSISVNGKTVRFPLQTHIDLLRALFAAAFDADEPFPQVLSEALQRCYKSLGWDPILGETAAHQTPRYPRLADLHAAALEVVEGIGYGKEVTDNVKGFVNIRIGSLRIGTTGGFFETAHPLKLDELLQKPTVIEIEDLGNDSDKAFLMGILIIRIVEILRLQQMHGLQKPGLNHVLVLEEAHRLLSKSEPGSSRAKAVEMFASLLAEVRAYGQGILVAEQIPSKIVEDVVKNSALKIVHRLPSEDDRSFVGGTMNLSQDQSESVVSFAPGIAAVFTDGMDIPIRVSVDGSGASKERRSSKPPTPPINRRGDGCSERCAKSPCTLRTMQNARLLATQDRSLPMWIELTLVAHLLGRKVPSLKPGFADAVREAHSDSTVLRCAIGIFVEDRVSRRAAVLSPFFDLAVFTEHLVNSIVSQLKGSDACDEEIDWQIAQFRFADISRELRAWQKGGKSGPHPFSNQFAERARIPRADVAVQLEAIGRIEQQLELDLQRFVNTYPSIIGPSLATYWRSASFGDKVSHAVDEFWDSCPSWLIEALLAAVPEESK
jgi:uncharacterized protein